MTVQIVIDPDKCIGIGSCEAVADDVFEVGDEGMAIVLTPDPPADRHDAVREAAAACPTSAITVTD